MSERKGESRLRADVVVPALRRLGLTVSTVEGGGLGGTPGIPDLHYAGTLHTDYMHQHNQSILGHAGQYVEGWIELKVLRDEDIAAKALVSQIPLVTGLGHFTSQQRVWITKHARAGGRCHVLLETVGQSKHWFLFDGLTAATNLGRSWFLRDFVNLTLWDERYDIRKFPDPSHLLRGLLRSEPPAVTRHRAKAAP